MPFGPGTYGPGGRPRRRPGQGAVSNTGERSTSTQTTGATGSVTNSVTVTASNGAPGAPGRTRSPEEIEGEREARLRVGEARRTAAEAADDAFARAEASLAMHRQRVLGMVPPEARDRVNAAFDRGHDTINQARQRRRS